MNSVSSSPQSKSFITLLIIILLGSYLGLVLSQQRLITGDGTKVITYNKPDGTTQTALAADPLQDFATVAVDTSAWKTFYNPEFSFGFKYKPDWKVTGPVKKADYSVFDIDPGQKLYNIKIYVSKTNFVGMDGLPDITENINGQAVRNVGNLIYGFQHNGLFYTFDLGVSLSIKDDFVALTHSVNF